jgi:TolB-like protein
MKMAEASNCTLPWVNAPSSCLVADDRYDADETSELMVQEQLARILQSPMFVQSNRLGRFLRFVVGSTLRGEANVLKEYVIGTEVYDRKPPYHPSLDSIVRTEARRLRSKLKEYYESEGKADPIFIYFRIGSYVPVFRLREKLAPAGLPNERNEIRPAGENLGVSIAVIPFMDISDDPLATECARGITEELSHDLMRIGGCRVTTITLVSQLDPVVPDIPSLARKLGVDLIFEGTVRKENRKLRITARIVDSDGFQLWSQRLESESDRHDLFNIAEQTASALISRLHSQESHIQRPNFRNKSFRTDQGEA